MSTQNTVNNSKNTAAELQKKREREERRRIVENEKKSLLKLFLILFGAIAVLSVAALLCLLLTDVVFVHNTGMTENNGREVTVSGIAFLKALFTGNYSSPDFDNLAVPFYLYAKSYCPPCAILTLFLMIFLILNVILSVLGILFAAKKTEYAFSLLNAAVSFLCFVLSIALMAAALGMKNGNILNTYCNNNPACSIRSDVVWCLVLSLLSLSGAVFGTVKYILLRKKVRA